MANMSYCRFQNTVQGLLDCERHLFETDDLSEDERKARQRLIDAAYRIVARMAELEHHPECECKTCYGEGDVL
jgi:hypothetical protein